MDDYLDQEIDKLTGKETLASKLGKATVPYALLSLSIAVTLNYSWTLSLFWASYIFGMGYDLKNSLPSGLEAYQESLLLLILGIYLLGTKEMISSLFIIFNLQLIDDLIDSHNDKEVFRNNFTHIFGKRQVLLLTGIMLISNVCLTLKKTLLVFLVAPLITFLVEDKGGDDKN